MEYMWAIWLVLAGIFFIGEIATAGFLLFWLGVGAVLALMVSLVFNNLVAQIAVFAISSILLIVFTKPMVKKFVEKEKIPTNIDSLIGKKGIVTKRIDPVESIGQVKVNGEVWSAKSEDDAEIAKDTEVEIVEIVGVKLVVKPCKVDSVV